MRSKQRTRSANNTRHRSASSRPSTDMHTIPLAPASDGPSHNHSSLLSSVLSGRDPNAPSVYPFSFQIPNPESCKRHSFSLATGVDVPPELFDRILDHMSRLESRGKSARDGLRVCSLVCVYWANRCREYLFRGKDIYVSSVKDLYALNHLDSSGSQRLSPLRTLVKDVILMSHLCDRPWYLGTFTSPVHRQQLPWFAMSRHTLLLYDRFPNSYSSRCGASHRHPLPGSLQWGFPKAVPGCLLSFTHVTLFGIRLEHLTSFLRPLQGFRYLEVLTLKEIYWSTYDKGLTGNRTWARSLRRVEVSSCTSNSVISLQTWQICRPTFPWAQLPITEQMLVRVENSCLFGVYVYRLEVEHIMCTELDIQSPDCLDISYILSKTCQIVFHARTANILPALHSRNIIDLFVEVVYEEPEPFMGRPAFFDPGGLLCYLSRELSNLGSLGTVTVVSPRLLLACKGMSLEDATRIAEYAPVLYVLKRRCASERIRLLREAILMELHTPVGYERFLEKDWERYFVRRISKPADAKQTNACLKLIDTQYYEAPL